VCFKAEDNASRDDLRHCYHSIFQKIEGNENEPAILKVARRRLYFAYSTLLRYHPYEKINTNKEINTSEENNTDTRNNTSNDPKVIEAARIMSASSNLEVLEVRTSSLTKVNVMSQTKDGASTAELKECFKKVMSTITKTTNEEDIVKESRTRVLRAYEALLRSTSSTAIIPVKNPKLVEAERVINASSDLEILQVCYSYVIPMMKLSYKLH